MTEITHTQEDYIRAIYLLSSQGELPVKVMDVVNHLSLSKSSVAQRLDDLTDKGWITHEKYGPVKMTKKGIKIGANLTYKHRVVELFLTEKLGMSLSEVHDEAHMLEHALSDKVIVKLAKFLDNPTHGPHGEELPKFNR